MERWKTHIPEGVQDFLIEECFHKREIETKIKRYFYKWGYDEIETPTFEYYDVFASGIGSMRQEQMFKFFDQHGRILVLRPDITMPIARIAATKLKSNSIPIRLSYTGNAFGYDFTQSGKQREFTQSGIELLGLDGPEGDAEVITLAISMLKDVGMKNFQIDIGQVEFFKGLMEEAGLQKEEAEELREYVDQKNMLGIELILKNIPLSNTLKKKIMDLPGLYGGPEVLDTAYRITDNQRSKNALDNIKQVYEIIKDFGLEQYVSIDLGMVQSINYYSGIIFRGMTGELGFPILGGGRYDQLVRSFGYNLPATGFAAGIKRILIALERQGSLGTIPKSDIIVAYLPESRKSGFDYIQYLRSEGNRVEVYFGDVKHLVKYACKKGASKAVLVKGPNNYEEYMLDQE